MIRAKMTGARASDGAVRQVLFLGLSRTNVEKIMAGQPIQAELDDVGFPGMDLLITGGETENDIKTDLEIVARRRL